MDDYWKIDGSRDLSDPWTGFTQFTPLEEKHPNGYMWSGGRFIRKQLTSRPDHLWPELWKSVGKNAKLKEKQKWSNEKLHLENARKCEGSISSTQRTRNSKKPSRTRVRSWETSMAPAMLCKILNKNCGSGPSTKIKRNVRVFWKLVNLQDCVCGESMQNHHEDHIAGKGDNSLQHYNLVHKFIPMPQALKIPAAKAAVD